MAKIVFLAFAIVAIAVIMAMTGRGSGNFYVPVLVAAGIPIYEAATIGQLILATTSLAALIVFQKHRTVDWRLVLVIDPPTDIMSFIGGYYAHIFSTLTLKLVFAFLLILASFFMLRPVRKRTINNERKICLWRRRYSNHEYIVNLWSVIPITAVIGFVAGMVGN